MFSSNPNRQRPLSVEEFLKIVAENTAKGIDFKPEERISLCISAESKAFSDKLINVILAGKLPPQLSVTFSKEWYDQEVEYLNQILRTLAVAKCPKGLEIRLDGIARDQACFKLMSALLTINPFLLNVEFVEGDNCLYMQEDAVEKNIQAIARQCTINRFIFNNPAQKEEIENFMLMKEEGLDVKPTLPLLQELNDALTKPVHVSHLVRK